MTISEKRVRKKQTKLKNADNCSTKQNINK